MWIKSNFNKNRNFKITMQIECKQDDDTMVGCHLRFMVFNATFNNISVISWQSVLLMEETEVPVENNRPVASHWQTLSHNVV